MAQYSVNQIRILLALNKRQMTKTQFSRRFFSLEREVRYACLATLLKDGLVLSEERPTPTAKHIPVYYFLSDAGKEWVKEYLKKV